MSELEGFDLTKRFWLFANRYYYSQGGLHDVVFVSDDCNGLVDFYDAFEDGEQYDDRDDYCWFIYDSKDATYKQFDTTGKVV